MGPPAKKAGGKKVLKTTICKIPPRHGVNEK
jgi:hypothetical protein